MTRQEDQKHIFNFVWPNYVANISIVIKIVQHVTHNLNCLLVWTAWNVVSINNDGYHVIATPTSSE